MKRFIDHFIDFVKEDYKKQYHNKTKSLIYSLKELDIHYEDAGYISFMNNHYQEFLKRKNENEFQEITILKQNKDFIAYFDKKIIKN